MSKKESKRLPELKSMYDAVCAVNPDFRGVVNACESYGEVVRCIEAAYATLSLFTPIETKHPVTFTPPAGAKRVAHNKWVTSEGLEITVNSVSPIKK